MTKEQLWQRYCQYYFEDSSLGFSLDISRMNFSEDFFATMEASMQEAFQAMEILESGAIANPDEGRQVGHYWLRAPEKAPSPEQQSMIESALFQVRQFTTAIHQGHIAPTHAPQFRNLLLIGIGGSALGPQFVYQALASDSTPLQFYFIDNTDPDGIDQIVSQLRGRLSETLVLVVSKSGTTPETHNAMSEVRQAYEQGSLSFAKHAVAITMEGSVLDQLALSEQWLSRFPMWDWVGGRTSELSAVGLLPAALQGVELDAFIQGAKKMDELTRSRETLKNPAALLALMWFYAGEGSGQKDMVVLPYKDRLALFGRYLQQLVMESLGKADDLEGNPVNQGLVVYGNKGSTDQHAYIQQLRDGSINFFATFIEVLQDREGTSMEVKPGVTAGEYLHSFFLGTREALYENDRESITMTLNAVTPQTVGALIALFERAVGFYASLIHINAYHQPGVEAGKRAANTMLELQSQIIEYMSKNQNTAFTAMALCEALQQPDTVEMSFKILEHLSHNPHYPVQCQEKGSPSERQYRYAV